MFVHEGAVVNEVQVSSGGSMFLSGGTARDTLVHSSGNIYVLSGGLMTGGIVSGGAVTG